MMILGSSLDDISKENTFKHKQQYDKLKDQQKIFCTDATATYHICKEALSCADNAALYHTFCKEPEKVYIGHKICTDIYQSTITGYCSKWVTVGDSLSFAGTEEQANNCNELISNYTSACSLHL